MHELIANTPQHKSTVNAVSTKRVRCPRVIMSLMFTIGGLRFSLFLRLSVSRRRVIDDFVRINFLARHAILLIGPAAEVDQLASLGTEGTPRIILPLNRLPARRTFRHKPKVRRKQPKVKAGRENNLECGSRAKRRRRFGSMMSILLTGSRRCRAALAAALQNSCVSQFRDYLRTLGIDLA